MWVFLRFWFEVEVNFFHREKLCRRDCLDYLKNRAKSGDTAVLELTFRNVSLGKWSKNWSSIEYEGVRLKTTPGRSTTRLLDIHQSMWLDAQEGYWWGYRGGLQSTNGIFLRRRELEKSEDMIASYTQNAWRTFGELNSCELGVFRF